MYCLYIRVNCEGGLYVQVSRVQATRAVSLPDVLEEGGGGRVGNKERSSGRRSKAKVGRQYHHHHHHSAKAGLAVLVVSDTLVF